MSHRHLIKKADYWLILIDIKIKYGLLKVCYVPTTSATFLAFFFLFAAATNSTNETNKAGGTYH
jgi:hypothetical protein